MDDSERVTMYMTCNQIAIIGHAQTIEARGKDGRREQAVVRG